MQAVRPYDLAASALANKNKAAHHARTTSRYLSLIGTSTRVRYKRDVMDSSSLNSTTVYNVDVEKCESACNSPSGCGNKTANMDSRATTFFAKDDSRMLHS
jgi:hypothetical protein